MKAKLDHLTFPLVVAEGLDVSFYRSVERLERHLEAIDVEANTYVAYDAEGRRLELGVTPPTRKKKLLGLTFDVTRTPQFVVVEGAESDPVHASELEALLVDYLAAVGVEEPLRKGSLAELIERASQRAGIM